MLRVGLTGAIASGKSTVAQGLIDAGFPVIDADKVAHGLYAPGGPVATAVVEAFPGAKGQGGVVNRKKLGGIVFQDPKALARLEAIVHPPLLEALRAWFVSQEGEDAAVIEAALWNKWDPYKWVDLVVTVHAPRETRKRWLLETGMTEAQAEARLDAQGPMPVEETKNHWVIYNEGSLAELETEIAKLGERLRDCRGGL